MRKYGLALAVFSVIFLSAAAQAKDYVITIKNNEFSPKELTIPAGEKIKLLVKNEDKAAIEFESHELKREKIIAANSEATISVGPLAAGSYPYFNEFNDSAKGVIIAK